ncbi:MAG: YkgJ family cysteine cluster protein [Sulfuritalea sp.]|nr:YkgJ family cysteine cluster protein [Sulfuritalea sp.]MBP6636430.1 YkgJ family cysteine cluster protein [Sulfuritalea sp.]MBP7422403.1 YkgJ family cysteine cluster protein [Sulfuritalea sp.]
MSKKKKPAKIKFDCSQCPGWCCSYERIRTTPDDIALLAKHFECDEKEVKKNALDFIDGEWFLRHRKDDIYKSICVFFDRKERHCGIYEVRPVVCHKFPWQNTCGYYDFLKFEREMMGDDEFIPLPYPK